VREEWGGRIYRGVKKTEGEDQRRGPKDTSVAQAFHSRHELAAGGRKEAGGGGYGDQAEIGLVPTAFKEKKNSCLN